MSRPRPSISRSPSSALCCWVPPNDPWPPNLRVRAAASLWRFDYGTSHELGDHDPAARAPGEPVPATIVVFILVLATTRAKINAAAFLIGWSVSLVVVFSVSYEVGGTRTAEQGGGHTAVEVVEILLGVALIFFARLQWRRRDRPRISSGVSRTLAARLHNLSPWEAAIVGVLKEPWALTATAAVVLVRDHAAFWVAVIAFLVFTVVSTATVGLTYLYFARRPGEAQDHLEALRDRVVRAGPAIAVAVYVIVGLYLIVDGVRGLAG